MNHLIYYKNEILIAKTMLHTPSSSLPKGTAFAARWEFTLRQDFGEAVHFPKGLLRSEQSLTHFLWGGCAFSRPFFIYTQFSESQ